MHGGLNMNLTKPKFKSQPIMNILFSVLAQKPQVWKETLIIKCNYNLKIKISEMCKKIKNLEEKGQGLSRQRFELRLLKCTYLVFIMLVILFYLLFRFGGVFLFFIIL